MRLIVRVDDDTLLELQADNNGCFTADIKRQLDFYYWLQSKNRAAHEAQNHSVPQWNHWSDILSALEYFSFYDLSISEDK